MIAQQIAINEVMASNATTIADEDGDFEDWIELYNYGTESVNLKDFGLSDNYGAPFKWTFPEIYLHAEEFIIVWASGKDRRNPAQPLHTNYRISSSGEEVILTNPDGILINELPPTPIPTDMSYGRYPDGIGTWYYYFDPTPLAGNTDNGYTELLNPPTFSHPAGWYENDFQLEIITQHPTAIILYTLDGSVPSIENLDENGQDFIINYFFPGLWDDSVNIPRKNHTYIYNNPIPIQNLTQQDNDLSEIITTYRAAPHNYMWNKPDGNVFKANVIRASTYENGNRSPTVTHTYLVDSASAEKFDLPVVSIVGDVNDLFGYYDGIYVPGYEYFKAGNTATFYNVHRGNYLQRGQDWERPVHLEYFEAGSQFPAFHQNLGLRIHGGFSRIYPLKGLRLYARNQYDDQSVMQFPFIPDALNPSTGQVVNEYKRLVLHDYWQHDMVAIKLMQPFAAGTQGCDPLVHLINGEFWGVTYAKARFDRYHIANTYGLDPDNVVMLEAPYGLGNSSQVYEGFADDILLYREMYEFAINNNLGIQENYEVIKTMLDIQSYVDYYFMFIFLNNRDWYGAKHFMFWRAREVSDKAFEDGKWRTLVWDFDMSMDHNWVEMNTLLNATHPEGGGVPPYHFRFGSRTALLRNLLENEEFRHYFINRFADLMNTGFSTEMMMQVAQAEYDKVENLIPEHYSRWHYHIASENTLNGLVAFAQNRPYHQRQHIRSVFNIADEKSIMLDVNNPAMGHVRINSVHITPVTIGIDEQAYPWTGTYFQDIPVQIEAVAEQGFKFSHWEGADNSSDVIINLVPSENIYLKAHFEATSPADSLLIHYWHFNNLPADTITAVFSDFSAAGNGLISYPGTGSGYLDRRTHRPQDPVSNLNLHLNQQPDQGAVLRVRNPSNTRELIIEAPSNGYENLNVALATTRTNNGATRQDFYYSVDGGQQWEHLDDTYYPSLLPVWDLVSFDLSSIAEVNDNEDLQFKIIFGGESASGASGNNRFDNITVTGTSLSNSGSDPLQIESFAHIYPNPATDCINITIEKPDFRGGKISMYRIDGRQVKHQKIKNKHSRIAVDDLNPGIYILVFNDATIRISKRLVII